MSHIEFGDCRDIMRRWKSEGVQVQTCVTSPPYYGLRDYGHAGQIGLEETPQQYVDAMVEVFSCVRDILRDDGTLWLNLGDSYAGSGKGQTADDCDDPKQPKLHGMKLAKNNDQLPAKNLIGIPWRVAFALQADGWFLRQDIIWHKPNPMPESVTDRCTKAHEYIFLLSKSKDYYFDHEAIKEKCVTPIDSKARAGFGSKEGKCNTMEYSHSNETGKAWDKTEDRNKRSVWTVTTKPYAEAHFACFPPDLIHPCIVAGAPEGGIVLDPFMGSGTTAYVAQENMRKYLGCELNPEYKKLQDKRLQQMVMI